MSVTDVSMAYDNISFQLQLSKAVITWMLKVLEIFTHKREDGVTVTISNCFCKRKITVLEDAQKLIVTTLTLSQY